MSRNFVQQIVDAHIESGRWGDPGDKCVVRTRFPPEPNGYMHIGHAKSIYLNHGLAREFGGRFYLRFDDTNPVKEEAEFVESIQRDIEWLGWTWDDHVKFASDYFETFYEHACTLIRKGVAYVDEQTPDQIREGRGTLQNPGVESPFRDRAPDENLDLFRRMREGEYPDASRVLRAKIDMASPNMNLRDPVMYRILHARHHRTGDDWCIYPMYDWAHGLEDSIEGITHSICTLEFENHRPLYDWFLEQLGIHHPQQIEFAGLALTYTLLSKRNLRRLVEEGRVSGWDDPRMPTIAGMRRRGFTPEAIGAFMADVGVTRFDSRIDVGRLENAQRTHQNKVAPRRMAVLDPLKVVIENWPEDQVEQMTAINNPEDDAAGTREVPFSRELWIERDDFMLDPPKKFFRLGPGREVRLRYGYWITCTDVVTNDEGDVVELRCTYDPETRGGDSPPDGRKVKGTLHWVSAAHAIEAEVRLYDRLFQVEAPGKGDLLEELNPDSLEVVKGAKLEPTLADARPGEQVQFERHGYFLLDQDSADTPVFNRSVSLRDKWK